MIVVVIIGILAAVAIPSYQGFLDKAKSSEAKVILSSIHTIEKVHYAEFATYHYDLNLLGLGPPPLLKYWKKIGVYGPNSVINRTAPGRFRSGGGQFLNKNCVVTKNSFTACAFKARVYNPLTDWYIDQNRGLSQGDAPAPPSGAEIISGSGI